MSKADRPPGSRFTAPGLGRVLFNNLALPENARFIVAYSGGCDSQVLLHAMSVLRAHGRFALAAAHFDHGLQDQSAEWEVQCRARAKQLGVDFLSTRQVIMPRRGINTEAQARIARYRWLDSICAGDDLVLTAHHGDDQAETFLLHLFSGKHLEQLSGIATQRPLLHGSNTSLVRPLLNFSRDQIADYACNHQLEWIEDPSNQDLGYYRNFLRHELVPVLYSRSKIDRDFLVRGAQACKTIAEHEEKENLDLLNGATRPRQRGVFCVADPLHLPDEIVTDAYRFASLLRFWIHSAGIKSPSSAQLADFYRQLQSNRSGYAEVRVGSHIVRYYNRLLFLTRKACRTRGPLPWSLEPVTIRDVGLVVEPLRQQGGLDRDNLLYRTNLELHWRSGGERFTLPGRMHSSSLKKLFQQNRVPPWERNTIPYLWSNDRIVWAHGIGCASGFSSKTGENGIIPKISLLAD